MERSTAQTSPKLSPRMASVRVCSYPYRRPRVRPCKDPFRHCSLLPCVRPFSLISSARPCLSPPPKLKPSALSRWRRSRLFRSRERESGTRNSKYWPPPASLTRSVHAGRRLFTSMRGHEKDREFSLLPETSSPTTSRACESSQVGLCMLDLRRQDEDS
jgi:hypothetical protein